MALFQSTGMVNALSGATASGGIAGGPVQNRSTTAAGKIQGGIDGYSVPASNGPANGDTLQFWPPMEPTARMKRGKVIWTALGAGATISVGKIDPNNSANTDTAHYLAVTDASLAGNADFHLNIGEQVGADPQGDQSTGNLAPLFGAGKVIPTLTFGGAAPAASATIVIEWDYISGT